jgi:hypothetical protein
VFLQQQLVEKDRRIKKLESLVSGGGNSSPGVSTKTRKNSASQTDRPRPVSWGVSGIARQNDIKGDYVSFQIGKVNNLSIYFNFLLKKQIIKLWSHTCFLCIFYFSHFFILFYIVFRIEYIPSSYLILLNFRCEDQSVRKLQTKIFPRKMPN